MKRQASLGAWWPFVLLIGAYPITWLLGLSPFTWPVVSVFLLVAVARFDVIRVPRGYGLWLLFMVWMLVSAVALHGGDRWLAWGFRATMYVSATLFFLYLYNKSEKELPSRLVVRCFALLWCATAIGGLIALVSPHLAFTSVTEQLLPKAITNNRYFYDLIHPKFAQVTRILSFPIGRAQAPFSSTNAWGANYALLTPFLFISWHLGSAAWRRWTRLLFLASIAPVVVSLNRGLWLSLGVGVVYVAIRYALAGRAQAFVRILAGSALVVCLVAVTPLGSLFQEREAHPHSDAGREALYGEAVGLAQASPLVGYGAPQPSERSSGPSVGTHGQLWLVLVSQGFPGVAFFVGWYLTVLWRTRRRVDDPLTLWCHAVFVIALVQLPIYEQLGTQAHIVMAAAALALRSIAGPARQADQVNAAAVGVGV